MKVLDTARGRYRLAIPCSIALHVCALVLTLAWTPAPAVGPVEAPVLALVVTIAHRPPGPVVAARGIPAAPRAARHGAVPLATIRHPAMPGANVAHPIAGHDLRRAPRAAVPRGVPIVALATPAAGATPEGTAVPHPTEAPGASGEEGGGNPGLFSATYPPAPATAGALDAIRAALPAHTHVRITVDESGRAQTVDWVIAPSDPSLAQAIRARLMALSYIPAQCDGLPCTGNITLAP
jgi:hypothetical protein